MAVRKRRSLWFRVRRKLDKKHYLGKYVFSYNRKKLDDYYESGLGNKYKLEEWKDRRKRLSLYLFHEKEKIERILGDTIFIEMARIDWLVYHYDTAKVLDEYQSGKGKMIWNAIGWIIPDGEIKDMCRLAEENKKEE